MSEREVSPLEDKLLGQAVANTESEIFRSAMDLADPDEAEEGDRSREEMGEGLEGRDEPEDAEDDSDDEGDSGKDEAEGDDSESESDDRDEKGRFVAKDDPKEAPPVREKGDTDGKFVPRSRLTEETNKRREIEEAAKVDRERFQAEIAATNRRLDEILARTSQPAQPQAQPKAEAVAPKPEPHVLEDPEGYKAWAMEQARTAANQEAEQVFTKRFVEASMADAHDQHGEAFVKAYEDLTGINPVTQQPVRQVDRNDPVIRANVSRILTAPNPGKALMNWARQQNAIREVGPDPEKFKEQIRTETREALMKDPEFRKQILADLRADAAQGENGRPRTRFPKSLTEASGGQSAQRSDSRAFDDSEAGVFEDVWSDRRAG